MGKTIARGEITIVDLIDIATYIYYSANADGSGATIAPQADTKYIGIYSGPAFEVQPQQPNELMGKYMTWSKYVGEDGQKGDKGDDGVSVSIELTSVEYAQSTNGTSAPTSGWSENIPTIETGKFLWTKTTVIYSDGTSTVSYSVSYYGIDGKDGKNANAYYIETNQEEILRFIEKDEIAEVIEEQYSPKMLSFRIYTNFNQDNEDQVILENDNYRLEYFDGNQYEEVAKDGEVLSLGTDWGSEEEDEKEDIIDKNTVYFSVEKFYSKWKEDINNQNLLQNTPQLFRFLYLNNNEILAIKILQMRNGVSEEMAQFNVYTNGINASIQNNKLTFDASGLTLYDNNGRAFWSEDGNLWLRGNLLAAGGTFTGTLEAAAGSFSGSIVAESGAIGGLTISDNALYSGADINEAILKIFGNGEVYAENITLGSGAIIKDFIKLGEDEGHEVYIRTPTQNNDYTFLESGFISLHSQGLLKVGAITLNGGDGSYGSAYLTSGTENGAYWKICDDGTANFKELTVDKITVQNSVMEIGKVQAVGSIMFFKDSWKVKSVNLETKEVELELTLKDENGNYLMPLTIDDYLIREGNNYYKVININGEVLTLDRCDFSKGAILTKIGKANDYLITIQGDSNQDLPYSTPNSLTLSSIVQDTSSSNDIPGYNKKLVLGDLSTIEEAKGIGLFAENVFLKGTLSTQVDAQSYAGVNTLDGAQFTKIEEPDGQSKIVFWAGAKDNSNPAIQDAPFQVTEKGSLYANQGRFEGALITRSEIKGSKIYTTEIHGAQVQNNGIDYEEAALKIFSTNKGIEFYKQVGELIPQLSIKIDGLYKNQDTTPFINLTEGVGYEGNTLEIFNENSRIFIKENYIGFGSGEENIPSSKIINNDGFNFSYLTDEKDKIYFSIRSSEIWSSEIGNFESGLILGEKETTGSMNYQKASDGFNLFVN